MHKLFKISAIFLPIFFAFILPCKSQEKSQQETIEEALIDTAEKKSDVSDPTTLKKILDTAVYDNLCKRISNGDQTDRWPVKTVYPLAGAILPFKRVVAYYGNFYSKKMGILGELPEDEMLKKLMAEAEKWREADTVIAVQPAIHYIAVTAQASPGLDNKYRLRMPFTQIDKAIAIAKKIDGIVILDVQTGNSTVQQEIPLLQKYLAMPEVHLAIDPEFSMKTGNEPGKQIGTLDAEEINYVSEYLSCLVQEHHLPPKILVIHRFTQRMVTNYQLIKTWPEVQMVMDMDGWGINVRKKNAYKQLIFKEPVQFAGFKIFYKNDTYKVGQKQEMQPEEILKLVPQPIYIQYQ